MAKEFEKKKKDLAAKAKMGKKEVPSDVVHAFRTNKKLESYSKVGSAGSKSFSRSDVNDRKYMIATDKGTSRALSAAGVKSFERHQRKTK